MVLAAAGLSRAAAVTFTYGQLQWTKNETTHPRLFVAPGKVWLVNMRIFSDLEFARTFKTGWKVLHPSCNQADS